MRIFHAFAVGVLLSLAAYSAQDQPPNQPDPFRMPPSQTPVEFPDAVPFPAPPHGPHGVSAQHLAHKPPKPALRQLKQGLTAERKGKNDQAEQHLQQAIRLDPDYWEAHANLADVYWREKRTAQALEELNLALAIDPNSETLQSNLAVALLALGRTAEAASAARRALKVSPGSVEAHYLLGMALLKSGKIDNETESNLAAAAGEFPQAKVAHAWVEEYLKAHSLGP